MVVLEAVLLYGDNAVEGVRGGGCESKKIILDEEVSKIVCS